MLMPSYSVRSKEKQFKCECMKNVISLWENDETAFLHVSEMSAAAIGPTVTMHKPIP